ncbi:MAG TPA: class I SAM-dependent methyltransferase [Polyangiaceae bacterium LLY-WYZ-15_(1-7)]|nr:class I SAM-dependent methyltransferase [Polyangiaceae bacterium LLY-WYZ-15_(1-7)]HJL00816.1 class I SAM-dependent methyltransferase [Polyangiaceae bacterium LLY-WYZ-15_(1-7)]HJL13536.1 class I SAM-dependent methyltransferase [Polyangiaceae bacterium LLY-WYZ-15_(1-7)]HJL23670.1 class I SAM-dependent methyltransferase [Polyangiaceae bacterium LLY-WYZ-15_(1-7)]HJL32008.1 class I SAM-dependent methyltransferase [Polyangiaceae bacterium LLY-WYZ-15_(1-7)]
MSREVREQAQPTGSRVLEMHAGTPRLNAWYYAKFADRIRGDVLELGSGIGNISRLLARDADSLVATDVEDAYLDTLRAELAPHPHAEVHRFDLDHPPPPALAARRFDVVISMNVLEHIHDDAAAVRQLVDLLRPGGWLLTYVPAGAFAFGPMDEALGHWRRYSTGAFRALMQGAGLRVDRLEYMNLLGLAGWWVNGKLLRRRVPDPKQVHTFEKLVPLVRLEDHLRVPLGLGLICHAQKPA